MGALNSKYHVKIGNFGFLLARQSRSDRHVYSREEAPNFVNKFSSGEPNYRDSTFFPHWVQLNWQNGFNQEFFDDGGKFYRSLNLDTTEAQKLKLERKFSSAGLTLAGKSVTSQGAFRSAANAPFKEGLSGALTISTDTTKSNIASAATGTSGAQVLAATGSFVPGQFVLIHQTRGSNHGVLQENKILSYSSGVIGLERPLNATYTAGAQVVVMEDYSNVTIDSTKTWSAPAWNGTTGGILAIYVSGTLTKTGNISADAKGFRGGSGVARLTVGAPRSGFSGESYNNDKDTTGGYDSGSDAGGTVSAGDQAAVNGAGGYGLGSRGQDGASGGGGAGFATAGTIGGSKTGSAPTYPGGAPGGTYGVADLSAGAADLGSGGGSGATDGSGSGSTSAAGAGGGLIYIVAKNISGGGSITSNGGGGSNGNGGLGGSGAGSGGSILIKTQETSITGTITATGGSGGSASGVNGGGGAGGNGRVHVSYLTSMAITSTPTANTKQDGTLTSQSASQTSTHIVGDGDGKVYAWDGAMTYTELFDTRRLTWFESDANEFAIVGDDAGTEKASAQSFQLSTAVKMKGLQVHLKKNAGTPGDITVRIETNSGSTPSGTLADTTNAIATIPAFTTTTAGWITVEFPAEFTLAASTTYWIVLKTAAAANDNNYGWSTKSTSGYTSGNNATSTNGGSTWSAGTKDGYFRILSPATSVNCQLLSDLAGARKLYFGVGNPEGILEGDGRIYSYDGTSFALVKTFAGTSESSVLCMREYGTVTRKVFIGLGHKAKIYSTVDFTTFVLEKTITQPNYPGYVFSMTEYAGKLVVGGGFPEQLNQTNYQYGGFLFSYDEFSWNNVFPFDHTVITSLEVFDTLLFIGTINKRLYVYNTANIDKLFDFPWDVKISAMVKWDDKLAIAVTNTPGTSATGNEGVYIFDRNGFHHAFSDTGRTWLSLFVFNNNLMAGNDNGYVFQTSFDTYTAAGSFQSSYDEASLPSIHKIRRSVTIMCESLPANTSIMVEYKTDESDASWTTLGTLSTTGATEATFNFASGVYSKKISFRTSFATTAPGSTPTLLKLIHKYVLSPDFKYLWKMRLACIDDIVWQDNTEPVAIVSGAILAGATTLTLKSTDDATPTAGFPDPSGEIMYATIIDPITHAKDEFSYTGKTSTTLTGIPASGSYALSAHDDQPDTRAKVTGKNMHQKILDLKQARQLYTFTDIDGITYTILFHAYQADVWSINQDDWAGGLENEVPITLLEA